MTVDRVEIVGFKGHELGQTLGDNEEQGGLGCCSPWGHKESDMTCQLNSNNNKISKMKG